MSDEATNFSAADAIPGADLSAEEEKGLRELSEELAGLDASPWQPRCIARAFTSSTKDGEPFVLTMQAWIDLDFARSPFLINKLPDAEEAVPQFRAAFAAFGYTATTPEKCEPDELILLGEKMLAAIRLGFSMRVRVEPPRGHGSMDAPDNGFGEWLSILACLKSQLGFSLIEALALPVGQAFALIAAHRGNQCWRVTAGNYSYRDLEEETDA